MPVTDVITGKYLHRCLNPRDRKQFILDGLGRERCYPRELKSSKNVGFTEFQATKNPALAGFLYLAIRSLAVSYSHMANATLPSALQRFTSVFGMGTGGSIALLPPGIFGLLITNS